MFSHRNCTTRKSEDILRESSSQRPLAADFLAADETVHRHRNGTIDILRSAVFRKPHFAEGFADTHDGFEMANLK